MAGTQVEKVALHSGQKDDGPTAAAAGADSLLGTSQGILSKIDGSTLMAVRMHETGSRGQY
jgi:hypothetical protein